MIIRYARNRGYQGESYNLTLNKEYLVLGLEFSIFGVKNEIHKVVIQSDNDNEPCLYDLGSFDIIDGRIPADWNLRYINQSYWLDPIEFTGDFWESFHDGDRHAESIFENVVNKIKKLHGIEVPDPLLPLDEVVYELQDGIVKEEYLRHLERYLQNERPQDLEAALRLVVEYRIKDLSAPIEDLLKHSDKNIRSLAIQCLLNKLQSWKSADKIYKLLLEDNDKSVRSSALLGLGKVMDKLDDESIKQKIAISILEILSNDQRDSWMQRDAWQIVAENLKTSNLKKEELIIKFKNKYNK